MSAEPRMSPKSPTHLAQVYEGTYIYTNTSSYQQIYAITALRGRLLLSIPCHIVHLASLPLVFSIIPFASIAPSAWRFPRWLFHF